MKLEKAIPVHTIAEWIGAKVIGNDGLEATGINEIHKVEEGDITFVDHPKYYAKSLNSAASIIIIDKEVEFPAGKVILVCDAPFKAYNGLAKRFRAVYHKTKPIADTAVIGKGTILEHNVVIGDEVIIGKHCYIHANVTIYNNVTIGDNVIIHSGAVIGGEAFYYKGDGTKYEKWHTIGQVIIEDDVEIGCNTTIDKGVSGDTIIGKGTKIDNLVHIAHGVVIGKLCLIAAQVGIAGKTIIGDNVTLYGQAGIAHGVTIGSNAKISAQAGVSKSLPGDQLYFGSPAIPARDKFRELAALRQLTKLLKPITKLLKGK